MAEAPLLADQLARSPALLDAVLTADFSAPLPGPGRARRRPRRPLAGARDFEDTLDLLRRWSQRAALPGRRPAAARRHRRRCGRRRASPTSPRRSSPALLPAVAADFARAHGAVAGRRVRDRRDGQARQPRDEPCLRSRPDPRSTTRPTTAPSSDGPRPLAVADLLRPAEPAADQRDHRADRRGPALRGRHAAAAVRRMPGRSPPASRHSRLPARIAWTWEHMALTRARADRRRSRRCAHRVDGADRRRADRAARSAPASSPMSPTCAGASPRSIPTPRPGTCATGAAGCVDLEFIVQYLMLREAARVPGVLCARSGGGARGARRGRRPAAAGARELGAALTLLRHLQELLALLFEGVPDPAVARRPARRDAGTLRRGS